MVRASGQAGMYCWSVPGLPKMERRRSALGGHGLFATKAYPCLGLVATDSLIAGILYPASIEVRCSYCLQRPKPQYRLQRCSQCQRVRYCGSKCQRADWDQHREECKLMQVTPADNDSMRMLVRLHGHNDLGEGEYAEVEVGVKAYYGQVVTMLAMLMPHLKLDHRKSMERLSMIKACMTSLGQSLGHGLFKLVSEMNHSCRPNVALIRRGRQMWVIALRPIAPGEELTFAYGNLTFACKCGHCHNPLQFATPPTPNPDSFAFLENDFAILSRLHPEDAVQSLLLFLQAMLNTNRPIPASLLAMLQAALDWWPKIELDQEYLKLYDQIRTKLSP